MGGSGTCSWRRSSGISRPFERCALDPSQRGAVRLDDGSRGGRHRFDGPLFPAVPARGGALRAGGVRVRSRAGTGAAEPPPVDLRRALGSRAGGRGPAAGRGTERCLARSADVVGQERESRRTWLPRQPSSRAVDLGQGCKLGRPWSEILQRYVSGEVLRAFLLALLTMTTIFVLFMVAAEAMMSRLLTPQTSPSSSPTSSPAPCRTPSPSRCCSP